MVILWKVWLFFFWDKRIIYGWVGLLSVLGGSGYVVGEVRKSWERGLWSKFELWKFFYVLGYFGVL